MCIGARTRKLTHADTERVAVDQLLPTKRLHVARALAHEVAAELPPAPLCMRHWRRVCGRSHGSCVIAAAFEVAHATSHLLHLWLHRCSTCPAFAVCQSNPTTTTIAASMPCAARRGTKQAAVMQMTSASGRTWGEHARSC